jgi:hypothetical protein
MTRILFATLFILSPSITQARGYTNEMFRQALANRSTSPDYVLITVSTPDGKTRMVCTTANLFLGAIHMQYGFRYSEDGEKRALDTALRQPDRSFTFTKPAAMRNLADYETPEALADVRRRFAGKSSSELLDREFIDSLTQKGSSSVHMAYRDATAHALLERGIRCRMGCIADFLIPHEKA